MAIDFPDSPNNGDSFTSNNKTWVFDGTSWNITSGTNSVADGAITTAKVADSAITTAKVAANAVTQAKLAASLSAVTVTTSANRDTAVPSPFTGQLVFLTDTKKVQVWDGSLWLNITLAPPEPPTSLSATALSTTSISVAFTAGGANGSPITNYKYALSTNGGSSYGAFTALDPADATSPITISGLTAATTYHIKLKAVNDMGDSVESSATSVSTLAVPDAPTNLSASNATLSTVDISFTAGSDNGYAITNYQYALSTNGGSSYGSFTALNPADASSPITITGLTHTTTYHVKLKAVNSGGAGPESSAVSFTTLIAIDYLVLAGGGGGGGRVGGGGGAGGYRTNVVGTASGGGSAAESALSISLGTTYAVTVGGGGTGGPPDVHGGDGSNSVFNNITAIGGGGAAGGQIANGRSGGSGGSGSYGGTGGSGTSGQGFAGGGSFGSPNYNNGGGGGAGAVGQTGTSNFVGSGGSGVSSNITGTAVTRGGGGGGGTHSPHPNRGFGGAGGGGDGGTLGYSNGFPGTANTGGGGGGACSDGSGSNSGGAGGSGVVIICYPSSYTITIGSGLTGTTATVGSNKVTTLTAGSGNVSWS